MNDCIALQGEGVGGETVSYAARWFRKARRLSRELLLSASYPRLVHALAHLALGVADTSKQVQTQEVSAGVFSSETMCNVTFNFF